MKLAKGETFLALFAINGKLVRVETIYSGFYTVYDNVKYYRFEHATTGTEYDFSKKEIMSAHNLDTTRVDANIDF